MESIRSWCLRIVAVVSSESCEPKRGPVAHGLLTYGQIRLGVSSHSLYQWLKSVKITRRECGKSLTQNQILEAEVGIEPA